MAWNQKSCSSWFCFTNSFVRWSQAQRYNFFLIQSFQDMTTITEARRGGLAVLPDYTGGIGMWLGVPFFSSFCSKITLGDYLRVYNLHNLFMLSENQCTIQFVQLSLDCYRIVNNTITIFTVSHREISKN